MVYREFTNYGSKFQDVFNFRGYVRSIFKNRPSKALLLDSFEARFWRLSELLPRLIGDRVVGVMG